MIVSESYSKIRESLFNFGFTLTRQAASEAAYEQCITIANDFRGQDFIFWASFSQKLYCTLTFEHSLFTCLRVRLHNSESLFFFSNDNILMIPHFRRKRIVIRWLYSFKFYSACNNGAVKYLETIKHFALRWTFFIWAYLFNLSVLLSPPFSLFSISTIKYLKYYSDIHWWDSTVNFSFFNARGIRFSALGLPELLIW